MIDRTGKGIRGPARDALIAATAPPASRGRAFGLHKAMDTTGAILGPLVGLVAMGWFGFGYRSIFLIAFLPALAGVALTFWVREPRRAAAPPPALGSVSVSPELRQFLVVVAIFSLGNSSNAFLLLRARGVGWSETGVIGLYVLYNIVYAAAAIPTGTLADRLGRRGVVFLGLGVFAATYAGLAVTADAGAVAGLLALYGVYAATTGSAMRALVADTAASTGAATAQGLYQAVNGVGVLFASLIAGGLWSAFGPSATFAFGAACGVAAMALFALPPGRSGRLAHRRETT